MKADMLESMQIRDGVKDKSIPDEKLEESAVRGVTLRRPHIFFTASELATFIHSGPIFHRSRFHLMEFQVLSS